MTRTPQFFMLWISLVVVFAGLGYIVRGPASTRVRFVNDGSENVQPVAQEASERLWGEFVLRRSLKIGNSPANKLALPFKVEVDDDGNIYVLDVGELQVKKFRSSGELVEIYGTGRGEGPGGFLFPSDFAVSPGGEIWVTDLNNGRITIFDEVGTVKRTIKMRNLPARIEILPDESFIVMVFGSAGHAFEKYGPDGERRKTFGRLLENQPRHNMALEGWIDRDAESSMIYTPLHAGFLGKFSSHGETEFLVATIDPLPLPRLGLLKNGGTRILPDQPLSAFSSGVHGDHIYVAATDAADKRSPNLLDLYDKETGAYAYSLRLPVECERVSWVDDHLYTMNGMNVTRWKVRDTRPAENEAGPLGSEGETLDEG
jgi:DNA-binding beta-propeller fold protein YncE